MTRLVALRIGALYVPIVMAGAAPSLGRPAPRRFAACLLSLLWTLPALLVVQRLNELAGWWRFPAPATEMGPALRGMPLELYLGWAIMWGLIPQLGLARLRLPVAAAAMAALDLVGMPAVRPLVVLGPHWLVGEWVALVLVLLPALALDRWTLEAKRLPLRAAMQLMTSALLFLYLIPEIVFALHPVSPGWSALLELPFWKLQLAAQMVLMLALPGVVAVVEFAQRGLGTPIPYDPPRRLVTSGIYRYCANPMQLSCSAVMVFWALLLRTPWLLVPAGVSIVYSAGLANWDEGEDLARRFGEPWGEYRANVQAWRVRWRPHCAGPSAKLYVAGSCEPCSQLRRWIEARHPAGLEIVDAESLPTGSIRRMRYDPGDGSETVDGVRALGRALEHLQLGWALSGALLRLPAVWQFAQMAGDASGLGPRVPTQNVCQREGSRDGVDNIPSAAEAAIIARNVRRS